ncbi:hypothetical protein TrST_g14083 [Triparma strigata]|uniref:C2 domain-containing protein n=1 Tax=Triparma strigata TaxID=1606541 RepID=A0A9W6ZRR0_9STRA|nr:hypothetical protein TrST_g14083 [Triparma strigata]
MTDNGSRLEAMRQRMRASRSPDKRQTGNENEASQSNLQAGVPAGAPGPNSPSKLEAMRAKRRQTIALAKEGKSAQKVTAAEKGAQQNSRTNDEALDELGDEMLMMTYRPARVFALGTTAPDKHVEQEHVDAQLFTPEAFTSWREMVGWDTERDREDMEAFKRRKERARKRHPFNVWKGRFNKSMFGTPWEEPPEYDSDDEAAQKSLLKEEGLFVAHGPEGVDNLIDQGRLYSRMKRDAEQAQAEKEDRLAYQKLADEIDVDSAGVSIVRDRRPGEQGDGERGPSLYEDFFHSDGNPRVAENPVIPGSHRPYTLDNDGVTKKYVEHLETHMQKTRTGVTTGTSGSGKRSELVVSLPRMSLYDHWEQNEEEKCYSSLRLMYGKYQDHIEGGAVSFLTRRINALVNEAVMLREAIGDEVGVDANDDGIDDSEQLRTLYEDILETVSIRLAEEHELRRLSKDLYAKWKDLKAARKSQGFTCTPARLIARAVDSRGGIDADGGQQDGERASGMKARLLTKQKKDAGVETKNMKEVLSSLKESLPWLFKMLAKTEKFNAEEKRRVRLESNDADATDFTDADMNQEDVIMRREQEAEKIKVDLLLEACDALLPKEGTDYILRLSNDEQYLRTDECSNVAEKNRRMRITKDLYYCQLLINDKVVGTTHAKPLEWPTFSVNFNKRFRCRLMRRPSSIAVQIVKSRGLLRDQVIASCMVSVPGSTPEYDKSSTHSLAPTVGWYQFAQTKPYSSTSEGSSRLQGGIMVGCEWGLDRIEDGEKKAGKSEEVELMAPSLPERPPEQDGGRLQGLKTFEMEAKKVSADTGHETKPAEFARERDFLSILPKLTTVDPNDPRNANLFRLSDMLLPSEKSKDVFRTLERELQSSFKVPGTTTVYNNIYALEQPRRHQLLKLRQTKPMLFSSAIPLSEDIIKKDENYRSILAAERRKHSEDEDTEANASNQRKAVDKGKIRDFVKRVRDSRNMESRRHRKRQVHLGEVVQEGLLPEFVKFSFDIGAIADFFVPPRKRGLRPTVKNRLAVTALVRTCRLLITIIGARNVPTRTPAAGTAPGSPKKRRGSPTRRVRGARDDDEEEDDAAKNMVQTSVAIRFQENEDYTRPVIGAAPLWKQTLDVPFRPPMGDFSPARLQQVRDNVEVMLFDTVEIDAGGGGGFYEDENSVRVEKRFLGNLSIPFSTIYMEGKVEGTFRLNAPEVCLGYNRRAMSVVDPGSAQAYLDDENEDQNGAAPDSGGDQKGQGLEGQPLLASGPTVAQLNKSAEEATYVKIMATLEPLLVAPPKDNFSSVSKEEKNLVNYAKTWVNRTQGLNKETSKRVIEALVPDMHGCKWMMTRYLRPLAPPPGCDTIQKCAHFVSMIPFLEDWQAFLGDYDMWCTCQQFIDILAGDWEEHATLLANYFMYLSNKFPDKMGADIYLVLGSGIPEGETVYVMRRDHLTQEVVMWNASTGMAYSSEDEKCPLLDVGCLCTMDNIWANIQKVGKPSEIAIDVNDKKAWRPFYSERFPAPQTPLPSIQEPQLGYSAPNNSFAEELQDELLENLKRDIRRWRRGATGFKGDASNRLRALLETLEDANRGEQTLSHNEHLSRLEIATRGRDMYGLPLNMSYTDSTEVVAKVKATGVHLCKHPDVDFALAVRVFPYHSNVLSVWVYFAALTPKT